MSAGKAGWWLTMIGCLAWAGSACAADPAPAPAGDGGPGSGWEFTVTPYFWAAGISGRTAQLGAPSVSIDVPFHDIWDHLDFAGMVTGEARKGPYSIWGDLMYVKLGGESATPRGILANSAELTVSTFAGTIGGGYTVLKGPAYNLDAVLGMRLWSVNTDLSLHGGLLGGREPSDSATWVDAMTGLRGNYAFSDKIYATSWALIGGGGADKDWDVGLGVGYRFNKMTSLVAGYRALGVNYHDGPFVFNIQERGPMIGLSIRF
jgi:hypothetical protein